MRPPLSLRADGVTRCNAPLAHTGMADDVDAQSDDDGGRWVRQPPKDGCIIVAPGWLAYLGLVVERGIYRRRAVV